MVALTAVLLVAVPAAATAAPAWRLPRAQSKVGDRVFTSTAKHCGASKFGKYTFRNGVRTSGRFGFVVFRVAITRNGALHEAQIIRFGGQLSDRQRAQTRRLLNRVSFRYVAGPPALVQTVFPNGSQQASRAFNPVRTRC
jgi:hypothetical protein